MKQTNIGLDKAIYYLTFALLFLAAALRTMLVFAQIPGVFYRDMALLAFWFVLLLLEPVLTRRRSLFFPVYLVIQSSILVLLLLGPDPSDYFAILFAPLSMRTFHQLRSRPGAVVVAGFTFLIVLPLTYTIGVSNALAFGLIYTAADVLFAYSSLTIHRTTEAHARNQAIQAELQSTNRQLQAYSEQQKQLAVARERNRLARELHDSVTQTIFSMTLTAQSARLLLDRDPGRVKAQLEHLFDLARSALAEMQTLISHLAAQKPNSGGLEGLLRQHLAERHLLENLSVSFEVEGNEPLTIHEQQALFRICQEGLNNIVKHAQATQAHLYLHLQNPLWIEIRDNGIGFQLEQVEGRGGIGLSSMRERAGEIGWSLQILTAPGSGACIRVEKEGIDERR